MTTLGCPDCQIPLREGVMNCYKCGQHRSYFVEMESLPPTSDKDLRSSKGADQQVLNSTRAIKLPATLDDCNREAARIAIQSAKIVNAYGTYVQVVGIVVGVLAIIAGFVLASKTHLFIFGLSGLIVGALDIAIFAVQGALFRMISNYVIARLEE
jgi:hypothetical protein